MQIGSPPSLSQQPPHQAEIWIRFDFISVLWEAPIPLRSSAQLAAPLPPPPRSPRGPPRRRPRCPNPRAARPAAAPGGCGVLLRSRALFPRRCRMIWSVAAMGQHTLIRLALRF